MRLSCYQALILFLLCGAEERRSPGVETHSSGVETHSPGAETHSLGVELGFEFPIRTRWRIRTQHEVRNTASIEVSRHRTARLISLLLWLLQAIVRRECMYTEFASSAALARRPNNARSPSRYMYVRSRLRNGGARVCNASLPYIWHVARVTSGIQKDQHTVEVQGRSMLRKIDSKKNHRGVEG